MHSPIGQMFGFIIPVVSIIAVFTFVAIASWSDNRRRERETYHRHETLRKILDQPSESGQAVLELLRHEELERSRKRVEGLRLGGLVTLFVGAGVMIFLRVLLPDEMVYMVGVIPLLIGLALAVYGLFLAPRPRETGKRAGGA